MAHYSRRQVLLLLLTLAVCLCSEATGPKQRLKREWIAPPTKLEENKDHTTKPFIAKIRSDKSVEAKVQYFLSGPGADQPPYGLFTVNHENGFVQVTQTLDREECSFYNLTGQARFLNGTKAEDDIPLTVFVIDENDNPPYFVLHTGNITEASKRGSFVMQVEGQDDDEAGTINSQIHYTIVSQEPKGKLMFTIDAKTGKVYVKEPTLDRETLDFYRLIIMGTDMGGTPGGLSGTGTIEIKVLDINDNIPTLEKSEYSGSVDENVQDVVVMRIQALDRDLEHTDNWLTVFHIIKGNENGLFSIETDKKTNEGILKLVKSVDFEEIQNLELGLHIENVAPGSSALTDVDVLVGQGGTGLSGGMGAGLDAGLDLGIDASVGLNAGLDAGLGVGLDAGLDAGLEVGLNADLDADLDAELDAGLDAGLDVGLDAGLDAGLDTDLGVDLGVDAGLNPELGIGLHPGPAGGPRPGAGIGIGLHPGGKPRPKKKKPRPKSPRPSYPVKISVRNMPEGPKFVPETQQVPVSEDPDQTTDMVIATYAATDPDTKKPAENVTYAKTYDPDNWFTVDENTAEIRLKKVPDRESSFLVNGKYIGKIWAITKDMPSTTATGTLAIEVLDANDHCPLLETTHSTVCSDQKTVHMSAFDEDIDPNGPPFTFKIIPENTHGHWELETLNETSAALHSQELLWPGSYDIVVEVVDAKGLSCPSPEVFTVDVCDCIKTPDCSISRAMKLERSLDFAGPAVMGLMITAAGLLLLVPLLLIFCQCTGANTIFADQFSDLPFEAKEHLIAYHTEGRGEDKDVPLYSAPVRLCGQMSGNEGSTLIGTTSKDTKEIITINIIHSDSSTENVKDAVDEDDIHISAEQFTKDLGSTMFRRMAIDHQSALFMDIALPDEFLEEYYTQKSAQAAPGEDALLEYDDEGCDSPAGSVDSCSIPESDNDVDFLDNLGPKFRVLTKICSPPPSHVPASTTLEVKGEDKTEAEPVVKPRVEKINEPKHTDVKTEVRSSTNISKSNVSTVSSLPQPPVTLPCSTVPKVSTSNVRQLTNISQTSAINQLAKVSQTPAASQLTNISQTPAASQLAKVSQTPTASQLANVSQTPATSQLSNVSQRLTVSHLATLPRAPPTIVVQQPQVYYAASPLPVQYIVQPPLQNTVLLPQGAPDPKVQGFYVVGGPQVSQSGQVIQSTQIMSGSGVRHSFPSGSFSSTSPLSSSVFLPGGLSTSTSPTSPTLLLPESPGSPKMEGWTIIGPNPEGNYMLVQNTSSSSGVYRSNPGSPQSVSPRGTVMTKGTTSSRRL